MAGAQIGGGLLVPYFGRLFAKRTTVLLAVTLFSAGSLVVLGMISSFWIAIILLVVWAMVFAIGFPVRQAYINGLIPSQQRATVLSSDNLISSGGAAIIQPGLGKTADIWGYGPSYIVGGIVSALALPFVLLARREHAKTDPIINGAGE